MHVVCEQGHIFRAIGIWATQPTLARLGACGMRIFSYFGMFDATNMHTTYVWLNQDGGTNLVSEISPVAS
jgi:hypothetical protein